MNKDELKELIDTMRGKLNENDSAKLSEDFVGIMGAYQGILDENEQIRKENESLKNENDEILKVNGQLFQRVGSSKNTTTETKLIDEVTKKPEKPEEEKLTIDDLINERGEWL